MWFALTVSCRPAPPPTAVHSDSGSTDTGTAPSAACVLPASLPEATLGPECPWWHAPDGLVVDGLLSVLAGARVVFGPDTRLDAGSLEVSGTAAAPVVFEAEDGERFAGIGVVTVGTLSGVVVRHTVGAAVRTGTLWTDTTVVGTSSVQQEHPSRLELDDLTIEDADGAGLWIDGSASATTPVRFVDVTGPLVSTTGGGLGAPMVDDGGGNASPWIEVRGADRVVQGAWTWAPQGVEIHLGSTLVAQATTTTDCCGYVTVHPSNLTIEQNVVKVAAGASLEFQGSELRATDVVFEGLDGATWSGFRSLGPTRTYGYTDSPADLVFERVTVRDAAGPVVDFSAPDPDGTLAITDSTLGPVAGGLDLCVQSSVCTAADLPASGNALGCAVAVDEPAACD